MFSIRKLAFAMLSLLAFSGYALADASVEDEQQVTLRVNYDKVCDYIESHSDEIIEASHNDILERNGTKIKLRNHNNREVIVFTVQEKSKRGSYGSDLVKSHEGGLTEQSTSIIVSKGAKGKVNVLIKVKASIENPRIGTLELKVEVNKSAKGIKEFLKKNLG